MTSEHLLEIQNLSVEFNIEDKSIHAVDDISFTLNRNETVGIVGESGSGKSITSLAIMGLLPSSGRINQGNIFYHATNQENVDLLKLSEKELRKYRGNEIAMIFQEPMTSLNPVFTCGNQVMEAILQHQKVTRKEAKAKTLSLFEEVLLPRPKEIYNSYPHELSGGQKQRVMIAMAISCNPAVLIADEPTTALDVTVQKTILELMKNLQQKYGMGLIFITHDLGVIADLADKVVVMYKGKIVEHGNISEVFLNPRHAYTKGLLACRPPLDKRLKILPTVTDFMNVSEDGIITEKIKSVGDYVNNLTIGEEERKQSHKEIYAQKPILQVKDLKTYFPISKNIFGKATDYVKAVDDVDFEVYPGETLGLVGESGCGKTTLGRTILKLVEQTEGEIIYNGIDITQLSRKELRKLRKDVQIIFQDPYSSLNPHINVGSAIMEPMKVHHIFENDAERKKKVVELMKKVGLDESHFYRYPHEFSGGQRQRICIARALALEPRFIVCDESVSALDVSVQAQVLNLLNSLKKEYMFTFIFISHDLSVVKFMSDRIIVMKDGKIQEMGDADKIYTTPQTEYTRNLIHAIPEGIKNNL